jgi:DNA-binding helix-hairpin-helix protein with protein kinase domain
MYNMKEVSFPIMLVLMGLFLIGAVCIIGIQVISQVSEGFESNTAPGCFTDVKRGSDGKIHAQPGDQTFDSLSEYVQALSDQYASGKLCVPPQVKTYRSPVEGVLGGLGVHAIGPKIWWPSKMQHEKIS